MQIPIDMLVVDDFDPDARATLSALRAVAPGAAVLRLKDGDQALQFLFCTGSYRERTSGPPRLILLELELPCVNGLKVLEMVRTHAPTSAIPVVFLSSSDNPYAVDRSYALGASGYIVKPPQRAIYRAEVAGIVERWLPQIMDPQVMDMGYARPRSAKPPQLHAK